MEARRLSQMKTCPLGTTRIVSLTAEIPRLKYSHWIYLGPGLSGGAVLKSTAELGGVTGESGFEPWVGKTGRRIKRSVFLPGNPVDREEPGGLQTVKPTT